MITVKQRRDGNRCVKIVTIGVFTEQEFGNYYRPSSIKDLFANDLNQLDYTHPVQTIGDFCVVTEKVYKLVAFDQHDRLITVGRLQNISNKSWQQYLATRKRNYFNWGIYRTAKRKASQGKWLRRPKTTQERRHSFDNPELVRKSRNATNLPNTWWDIILYRQRNWKKHRKTQWKS